MGLVWRLNFNKGRDSCLYLFLRKILYLILGYDKNENSAKQIETRRNGHSKKTVVNEYSDTELLISRDREGEHEPLLVKKHQRNLTGIEEQII